MVQGEGETGWFPPAYRVWLDGGFFFPPAPQKALMSESCRMELREWLRTWQIVRETAWLAHVQYNPPDPIAYFNVNSWKEINTQNRPEMVYISCLEETVAEAYTFYDAGADQAMKTFITSLSANSKCWIRGGYGVRAGSSSFFCYWGLWCPLTPYVVPIILPQLRTQELRWNSKAVSVDFFVTDRWWWCPKLTSVLVFFTEYSIYSTDNAAPDQRKNSIVKFIRVQMKSMYP